jgi:hypothetical protein
MEEIEMNKLVGFVLLGTIAFLGAFDLVMMIKFGPDQTISWFVWQISQQYPIVIFLGGVVVGHLTFPMRGLTKENK